jgi:hypothetical protein
MKKLILAMTLSTIIAASCGTTKQATDSEKLTREILSQTDSLVEIMPKFRGGGLEEFRRWMATQVHYPRELLQGYVEGYGSERSLQGQVVANFAVEPDGTIQHVRIISSFNRGLSLQVVNAIRNSPAWTPGYQEGKAVRVFFVMPVAYQLAPSQLEQLRRERYAKMTGNQTRARRF